MILKTYPRRLVRPDRTITWIYLERCVCGARRGPEGGKCGNCGNAIPSKNELPKYKITDILSGDTGNWDLT